MLTKHKYAAAVLAVIVLATGIGVGTALAREGTSARQPDKIALGAEEVKQLVLLMDQDRDGRVSEHEFMSFMKSEFERLDTNKSGELDVKRLKESQIPVRPFTAVGK